jgi:hypothetical protein
MIVKILFLTLQISFFFHILFLVQYILRNEKRDLKRFLVTAVSNTVVTLGLIIIALSWPTMIHDVDFKVVFWIFSGVIMIIMLVIKISIFVVIYRRSKDPAHYHLNFFGKKVLHATVVKPIEVVLFMFTIPFFLISGAYFIALLINLILYKHL